MATAEVKKEEVLPSLFITGGNRGLGLEWVRQYAQEGWRVYASCRHPAEAKALQQLAERHTSLSIHRLDVTKADDVRAIIWEMEAKPIDLLICNAGVYLEKGRPEFGCLRYSEWDETFEVNTKGAVRVIEALVENVAQSQKKLIAVISSHMGSITDIQSPGSYYYRSSKAALNAAIQGLSVELQPQGIGVLILHPGGVKTRMGPRHGISPEESVAGMRSIIEKFRLADTGRFFRYDGQEMPW
jgi:NAD(P)-dependent dehydrogenase (short-subunit alcohol dehydrogenase family)